MKLGKYIPLFLLAAFLLGACKTTETAVKSKGKELSDSEHNKLTEYFFDATKDKQLGNFDDALRKFAKCLEIDPDNHASMYEMASIYFHLQQDQKAFELANKAVKLSPKNEYYRLLLADLYSEAGKHQEAANIYEKMLKDYPEKIEYYYEWANSLLYANKYDDAIAVYDKLEEVMGISEEISIQKQKIYLSLKKTDKAIAEIQKLIDAFPNEGTYYGMLAEIYSNNGMDDKAAELYQKMEALSPNDPLLHLSLAEHYKNKGEKEKSFSELKKAFESSDLDIDTKINILLSYYAVTEKPNKELIDQAFELLDILVEVHPEEAKAFAMKADFLFRENKMEEARDAFRIAIELDQSRYLVWSQLLIVESELRDYESLLKESEEALELFPNQAMVYLLNGVAKIQLKKYEEAAEILESGLIFARDTYLKVQILTNIGDVYNTLENYKKSDAAFDKALKLEPENATVLNNYSYYLSLRKEKLDKAAEMSSKSLKLEPESASFQDTYGWILYQQRNYAEAKKWLFKSMENSGEASGTILEHYGDTLYQLGETEEAVKYWKKAKEAGDASDLIDKKLTDKKLYE